MTGSGAAPSTLFPGVMVTSRPLLHGTKLDALEAIQVARSVDQMLAAVVAVTEDVLHGGFLPSAMAWVFAEGQGTSLLLNEQATATEPVTFLVALPELVYSAGAELVAVRTVQALPAARSLVSVDVVDADRHLAARAPLARVGPRANRSEDWQAVELTSTQARDLGHDTTEMRRAMAQLATGAPRRRNRVVVDGPFWRAGAVVTPARAERG